MPKVKREQKPKTLSYPELYTDHFSRHKNGFKNVLGQHVARRNSQKSSVEIKMCSIHFFPHLMYVIELTRDFMDRATCIIHSSKNPFFLQKTIRNVQIKFVTALPPQSMLDSQCEDACTSRSQQNLWPYTPIICVRRGDNLKIINGTIFIDEKTYMESRRMLKESCLDVSSIKAAISKPEVRDIHEALTELLETPIWNLLTEIKHSYQVSKKRLPETLSMELDILLNTVKHSSIQIEDGLGAATYNDKTDVPERLKTYLYRKREVGEFFFWKNDEFCVFVKHKGKEGYIEENLKRMYPRFFSKWKLSVLVSNVHISPCLKQGDKIYPKSNRENIIATEENGYGTLGGFVRGKILPQVEGISQSRGRLLYERDPTTSTEHDAKMSRVFALTCSHVCKKDSLVYSSFEQSSLNRICKCVFSSDLCNIENIRVFADLALIEIDKNIWDKSQLSMMNHNYEESKVCIYKEDLINVINKEYVYKIGATTAVRKGLIISPEFHKSETEGRRELFVVSGVGVDPFSEEGDSGSLVFMYENSSTLDTIKVIGMFWGKGQVHCNDDSSSQEKSFCFRLDKAFEILHQNRIQVRFENQLT